MWFGLAPALIILDLQALVFIILLGGIVIARATLRKYEPSSTHPPRVIEYLLGTSGAVFVSALLGFLWLIVYAVVVSLFFGVEAIIDFLEVDIGINPQRIALVTSSLFGFFGVFVSSISAARNMARQLFPNIAGTRPVFYELLQQQTSRVMSISALLLIVLLVALLIFSLTGSIGSLWFYLFLQFYILVASSPLYTTGAEPRWHPTARDSVRALIRVFESAGYTCIESPRTGDAEVDPLVTDLDIFVYDRRDAFAVGVLTDSDLPVSWIAAADLRMAALAFEQFIYEFDVETQDVQPLLVLVGAKADQSLVAYAKDSRVGLHEMESMEQVKEILQSEDPAWLQAIAEELLAGLDRERSLAMSSHASTTNQDGE